MIYLGGSCSREYRPLMEQIAYTIRNSGREIYCPFELKIPNAWGYSQEEWAKMVFDKDFEMLNNSDLVLIIIPGRTGSAGVNWEQGYAYAKGKHIKVIQFLDSPTSLMTYNGCTEFYNVKIHNILEDIIKILDGEMHQDYCKTTLT